ncbi:MAG: LPS-assembly protein LptD [Muribaculaceae bacterium]|nr:LPS-assembly protein LptD [Muribaculaceae bacterium]
MSVDIAVHFFYTTQAYKELGRFPFYRYIFFLSVLICAVLSGMAQAVLPPVRELPTQAQTQALADSVVADLRQAVGLGDTIATDTVPVDSAVTRPTARPGNRPAGSRFRFEKVDLDNVVDMDCADSMIMVGQNISYMYGKGQVTYGELKLDAAEIRMDMKNNTVYAQGAVDSVGEVTGKPIFSEGGTDYETQDMSYNFKTKRGYINNVITQQGEGYLTGGQTKKTDDDYYYIQNAKYTTCDDHDHPHFYFQLTKAKMKPKSNIVTGPAYMVLLGVPLPLAVPFGYFPFSDKYSSGIIFPTFGDDYNRGFYLSDGGYYFAINDNVDLAITGEVYTKGSWGLSGQSTYSKRYKFSGNFSFNYLKTITGDKGLPDYNKMTNFQVLWSHSQDSKANPNMSLSASVNFTTSGYSRNALNSYYSSSFTENTKSSSVNMTYRFPQSKWSISSTLNLSQRTQDSTLTVSFPNFTVTMSQVYPFKRKRAVGDEKWYEKIRMSYSGQFQNSLTAKQDVFFKKSLIKDWRNAMKHYIPVSATFNMLNYVNVTPSVNLTDRMYTNKIRRQWDPNAAAVVADTTYGFYNVYDFQASVSVDTKLYGFYQPLPFLGDKVKMIRHVLTPSVTFSGAPDFSKPFYGYYGTYEMPDQNGVMHKQKYSMFQNALYGVPGQGKSGTVSVALNNNLEMKVKSDKDSIGEKKVSLIENLSIMQSYNFAADSLNWSNINTSILLRLVKNFNLNLSAVWDVYTYQLNSAGTPVRVNVPRWKAGKGIGKLASTGTSFSYTFNNDTFKRKDDKNKNNDKDDTEDDVGYDENIGYQRSRRNERQEEEASVDNDGYSPWPFPWSLTFNYSINYGYGSFNYDKMEYNGKITQNLSVSGNLSPTPNWTVGFSSSYNFQAKKLAYMSCNISRDLHCFTMSASVIPVGPYKSFNFHIAVKSSLLSDVKYDKRSSTTNGVTWY